MWRGSQVLENSSPGALGGDSPFREGIKRAIVPAVCWRCVWCGQPQEWRNQTKGSFEAACNVAFGRGEEGSHDILCLVPSLIMKDYLELGNKYLKCVGAEI